MAQLPPKVPTMTHPNWPPSFPPHQRMPPLTAAATISPLQPPPSWVDEFLDFTSARRGSHRRSMSDSIAFLEAPLVEECRNSLHGGGATGSNGGGGFDRLDDEQLMSMFSDDLAGGMPGMVGPPSSPSDQNSNNEDEYKAVSTEDNKNNDDDNHNGGKLQHEHVPKSEPGEVESACDTDNPGSAPPPSDNNATGLPSGGDPIVDPKRVKRILANRQSAQRSRVRKLQYISDLERSVTTLQTEVSALSPRVAFLDHQRLILNVDNSALKQRIAALAQDKIFKDAHQEALKKEIERLRQIYQQQQHQHQNLKKMQGNTNNTATAPPPPSSDLNMGCTDTEPLMT